MLRKLHNLLHPKVGEVWMLHRVVHHRGDQPQLRRLEVEPDYLARRLDALAASGADIVALDEVPTRLARRQPFVCLTLDDGYLDTFTHAYPLLRERQLPFCLYATRDFYRGTARPAWWPEVPMMTADHLRQLALDPLCTLGAHTCTHPRLSQLDEEAQRRELADGKEDLEQLLGIGIRHLAYPHGDHNSTTLRLAAELGFLTAVTTSGRPVRTDSQLLRLDRITLVQP